MKGITVAVAGAGVRGEVYADYAFSHPEEMRVIAIAEPHEGRRRKMQERHGISEEMVFMDAEALLDQPRLADAIFICTQDHDHYKQTMRALELGYHVLLEKPMSPSMQECKEMERKAEAAGSILSICHVLRYTPFFSRIKAILESGKIGRLMTVQHNEYVGYWHQAHSFVRGNWNHAERSSPMILAKACHDMDILQWLIDSPCEAVSSFGALSYFKPKHAPEGAPLRCLDGCPAAAECEYYAPKHYLTEHTGWPTSSISVDMSYEARWQALKDGPYGRCVFHCDNNVVDHQVASFQFQNEVTAVFTMTAFARDGGRFIHLTGTKGEIRGAMEQNEITVKHFDTGEEETITLRTPGGHVGHGGGDMLLVRDFISQVKSGTSSGGLTSAANSVQSHLLAFAAEASRRQCKTIMMEQFQ